MDNTPMFTAFIIGLCVILVLAMLKPMRILGKVALNSALGVCAFLAANFFLSPINLFVGVNAVTIFVVGVLGLPGFICVYLSKMFLG